MPRFSRQQAFHVAIFLIAFVAAWPLLAEPGLLNTRGGGDSPFLLQRLHQLETAVLDGHFPVRWMPDANYGYGYPFFNYYAPLSIYLTALFRLLGFSFVRAIQLSQLLGFVVAAWGMFALARRWFKDAWAGLLAATAYTVAPFHLVNVYVRGDSLAEFWAMAFYPLVILAADRLLTGKSWRRNTAVFALAYAALILSHNISAMIFSPFLLVFLGIRRWEAGTVERGAVESQQSTVNSQRSTVRDHNSQFTIHNSQFTIQNNLRPSSPFTLSLLALTLALALSAWFFVPALADQELAQLDTVTEGYFNYNTHFLATEELPLIQDSFFFDFDVRGRKAFRMGLVQGVTAVVALLLLITPIFSKPSSSEGQAFSDAPRLEPHASEDAHSTFVQKPASEDAHFAFIQNIRQSENKLFIIVTILISTFMMTPASRLLWDQLPLLSFTQFPWRFLSVQAFGIGLATAVFGLLPYKRWLAPLLIGLLFASSLGQLKVDHLWLTDADVTAEKLAQYEWFTGNIGTTVSAEYLPQTVQPRPYTSPWLTNGDRYQLIDLDGGVEEYELLHASTRQQQWQVTAVTPTTVVLPLLAWPGWETAVNGERVETVATPGSGLVSVNLPPGQHTLTLTLTRTPIQQTAELISLFAIILTLTLLAPSPLRPFPPSLLRSLAPSLITITLLAIILHLLPTRTLPPDTLTWDFGYMGYLHHDVAGVPFDGGAQLNGYDYSDDELFPGERLTITLDWAEMGIETAVQLVTPASNRPEFAHPAPVFVEGSSADGAQFTLTLPDTLPAGLYVPRILVEGQRPLAPSGAGRNALHLRPIRVVDKDDAVIVERPTVELVEIEQVEPELMQLTLAWQLPHPVATNYNVSLRLTDANGNFLRLADRQPGYGFLPSSGWPINQPIYDWHLLELPPAAEQHAEPFIVVAQLYDVATGTPFLTRRLGEIDPTAVPLSFSNNEPSFTVPDGLTPFTAVFGDQIQLEGYAIEQSDETLLLTLAWRALTPGQQDYVRFVHLVDAPEGNVPIVQVDDFPQNNSYPTSQWIEGEVVIEQIRLPLEALSEGVYTAAVGFYEPIPDVWPRLTAVDAEQTPLPDNRLLLPIEVIR